MGHSQEPLQKRFGRVAEKHGFVSMHGSWVRTGPDSSIVLQLQRSRVGPHTDLCVKVFLHARTTRLGRTEQEMATTDVGDIFRRPPKDLDALLAIGSESPERDAAERALELLFTKFVGPFSSEAMTIEGILRLASEKQIVILPAIEKDLMKEKAASSADAVN